eukprot:11445960-Prorocentrum_lima.AAC.1
MFQMPPSLQPSPSMHPPSGRTLHFAATKGVSLHFAAQKKNNTLFLAEPQSGRVCQHFETTEICFHTMDNDHPFIDVEVDHASTITSISCTS